MKSGIFGFNSIIKTPIPLASFQQSLDLSEIGLKTDHFPKSPKRYEVVSEIEESEEESGREDLPSTLFDDTNFSNIRGSEIKEDF